MARSGHPEQASAPEAGRETGGRGALAVTRRRQGGTVPFRFRSTPAPEFSWPSGETRMDGGRPPPDSG